MSEIKTEDLAKLFKDLTDVFEELDSKLESGITALEEFLLTNTECDSSKKGTCKPKEKKEELKTTKELSLGEFIILEALNKKLIDDNIERDDIIPAVTEMIVKDPIIKLFDNCAANSNFNVEDENYNPFAKDYCHIMTTVLASLRQVDISKLRVK